MGVAFKQFFRQGEDRIHHQGILVVKTSNVLRPMQIQNEGGEAELSQAAQVGVPRMRPRQNAAAKKLQGKLLNHPPESTE